MNTTTSLAKQNIHLNLAASRTPEEVYEAILEFMEAMTHTEVTVSESDVDGGTKIGEVRCGCEWMLVSLSNSGRLSFRHKETIEVQSVGGALFITKPKFAKPLYDSFNEEGERYAKDVYNGIMRDAFHILIDVLFDENIFL